MIRVEMMDVSVYNDPELFAADYRRMPSWRQEKIRHLRYPKDQRLSLGAGRLLLQALAAAGLEDAAPEIAKGEYKKPYFPAIQDRFRFSLSHSGQMALCVSSFSGEGRAVSVGCDIEKESPFNPAIPERFFHPEENSRILALTEPEEQQKLFTRLWTLKESFVKAAGTGLALPLNRFCVRISEDGRISLEQDAVPGKFLLWEIQAPDGYHASVCAAEEPQ